MDDVQIINTATSESSNLDENALQFAVDQSSVILLDGIIYSFGGSTDDDDDVDTLMYYIMLRIYMNIYNM